MATIYCKKKQQQTFTFERNTANKKKRRIFFIDPFDVLFVNEPFGTLFLTEVL